MNKVILMGRLTADPEVRYGGANNTAVARFSLAVNRRFKREGDPEADFFNIVAFGRTGEFAEKYLRKGTKVVIDGELRNNNYTNKDGQNIRRDEIVANNVEFAESKNAAGESRAAEAMPEKNPGDGFMDLDGTDDELPFN